VTEPLELTKEELIRLTGYRIPRKQLEVMRSLGIPARMRPDNSVLVLRMHCQFPMVNWESGNPRPMKPTPELILRDKKK
jgi:uncharacterized protein DUF4224